MKDKASKQKCPSCSKTWLGNWQNSERYCIFCGHEFTTKERKETKIPVQEE